MSNIHLLPDVEAAEREASEWIARLHGDDVTPDEVARFEAWRAAHPRHARAYEELSATVNEVKRAGRLVRAVSFGSAMAESARPVAIRRPWLAVAAAAAVLAIGIATAWWMARSGPQSVFQTAIGEHASVELPDGSRLELNSNSMARVEYTEGARTIRLSRGEAYFDVAHEPQRSFWVVAGDSWIRAVGTAFNVDLRSSGVHVLVSEGTVKVAGARKADEAPSDAKLARASVSVLTAGQQAEVRSGSAKIRAVAPPDLSRVAAWRKGKLYFENQPLEAVVDELTRYAPFHIRIEDEALGRLPIGGTFQANAQGIDALLGMLEEGFGLRVRRESGGDVSIESAPDGESGDLAGGSSH